MGYDVMGRAKAYIDEAFNDTSISPEESVSRGKELQEYIQMNIDALKESYPDIDFDEGASYSELADEAFKEEDDEDV